MTAVELKYAIQQKRVGVEELVKTYLERIEKHDGIDGLYTIAELDMSVIHHIRQEKWIPAGSTVICLCSGFLFS
jgi:Asp-tRNA(Asn)/Glu-tRNA(Gln) amidotransferase A subunit family amidase